MLLRLLDVASQCVSNKMWIDFLQILNCVQLLLVNQFCFVHSRQEWLKSLE